MEKKTSIKKKLTLTILWITGVALALAFIALVLFNKANVRNALVQDLAILSKVTATNVSSPLVFLDGDSAHEILSSLSAHPSVMMGCLYDSAGNAFAAYISKKANNLSCLPTIDKSKTLSGQPHLSHIQPVVLDSESVGFLQILIELDTFEGQVKKFGLATFFIFICALLLVFLLSKRLQKVITFPILSLLDLVRQVSSGNNYSLRVEKKHNDEIGDLIDEFNEMLSRIEKRDKELKLQIEERTRAEEESLKAKKRAESASQYKSIFLANMSHEIRTPMNAILGFSQVLMNDKELNREQRNSLETISEAGNHLLALINDILDISKIEAGQMELNQTDFDLNHLLHNLSLLFQKRCQDNALAWKLEELKGGQHLVHGDETKLRQVLINLLGNAVKFTDSGEVGLVVKQGEDNFYRFEVFDSGVGIPQDAQNSIFETFQQDSEGIQKGGTGLGLAISKKQVELMGGNLEVASVMGEGSQFYFTLHLPLAQSQGARKKTRDRKVFKLAEGCSVKALIVDDLVNNRTLLSLFLKRIGVEVAEAEDGKVALEKIRENTPDIIFMDIRMPVMDGIEATKEIFKEYGRDRIKVIAFMASTLEHEREEFMGHGFHDFVMKPGKQEEIYECLNEQLDIEFIYEVEVEPADTEKENDLLDPADIEIPENIHSDLVAATEMGEFTKMEEILADLESKEGENHPLLKILSPLVKAYDVDGILAILEKVRSIRISM